MDREKCTEVVLGAKQKKGVTFQELADGVGRHIVWTTAAIMGQATMDDTEAQALTGMLGLDSNLADEVASALQQFPMKGSLDADVPVDPLIYRLHEITQVYGTTIKAVIHEKFGDGIMSAIDFEIDIEARRRSQRRSGQTHLQRKVPALPQVVTLQIGRVQTNPGPAADIHRVAAPDTYW